MSLTGKFVLLNLSTSAEERIFTKPETVSSSSLTPFGRVQAETQGVGFWLRLDALFQPDGEALAPEPERTILIRWEWVERARLLPVRPKRQQIAEITRSFGFRPR